MYQKWYRSMIQFLAEILLILEPYYSYSSKPSSLFARNPMFYLF
jgi:hypothetical protein